MSEIRETEDIDWGSVFEYRDGKIFWKKEIRTGRYRNVIIANVGEEAFTYRAENGYYRGWYNNKQYSRHQVIWEMFHPDERCIGDCKWEINHINGVRGDDRIENLERIPAKENRSIPKQVNMWAHNTSGCRGVSYRRDRDRWIANIHVDGVTHRLGSFLTFEEAKAARELAEHQLKTCGRILNAKHVELKYGTPGVCMEYAKSGGRKLPAYRAQVFLNGDYIYLGGYKEFSKAVFAAKYAKLLKERGANKEEILEAISSLKGFKVFGQKGCIETTELVFRYVNWKGKESTRRVDMSDAEFFYGKTQFHPEDCYLMHAFDIEKGEYRDFKVQDIVRFY